MIKPKLYLAGPLFNASERELSDRIASALSGHFEIYLPHIDGSLLPLLIAGGMSSDAARIKIFADDIAAIKRCDFLLIILNGRSIDEGAAFELGVAWALGKMCFGYKDDFRQLTSSGDNPMIERALNGIFNNFDQLRDWCRTLKAANAQV